MAGTVAQVHHTKGRIHRFEFTCVGDSSNGSFPSTELTDKFEGRLLALETNPGDPAPQDNYDIQLNDAEGYNTLEAKGANRSTDTTQKVAIVYGSTDIYSIVDTTDTLSIYIANNNVNSAKITVILYYTPSI